MDDDTHTGRKRRIMWIMTLTPVGSVVMILQISQSLLDSALSHHIQVKYSVGHPVVLPSNVSYAHADADLPGVNGRSH